MPSTRKVFEVGPRAARPQGRLNVAVALAVSVVAALAYLAALSIQRLPGPEVAVALLTAAPAFGLVALLVYGTRALTVKEPLLTWAAAGVTVSVAGVVVQYLGYPTLAPDGGPLGTDNQSSAALYAAFHLALFLGAIGGAAGLPRRAALWYAGIGTAAMVALGANLWPLPLLLEDDGSFTDLMIDLDIAIGVIGIGAALAWSLRAGWRASPLDGWYGVGTTFAVASIVVGSSSDERFDALWWSSLSMRVAIYATLALGAAVHLTRDLHRVERYADGELTRREGQLTRTVTATEGLMHNAVALSRAQDPQAVGDALCDSIARLTGCERSVVLRPLPDGLLEVVAVGPDATDPQAWVALADVPASPVASVLAGGGPEWVEGVDAVRRRLAGAGIDGGRPVARLAVVPLVANGVTQAVACLTDEVLHAWPPQDRALLEVLMAQGGPALVRAREHADTQHTAELLQRALLPSSMPAVCGLTVTSRYVPGDRATSVGGDWYDAMALPDGRVVLSVGDVVGKGVDAATAMGALRQSIRVLADHDPTPTAVLRELESVSRRIGDQGFATVVYLLWDPASHTVQLARAGHVPPLLVRPDGTAIQVDGGLSPPLGATRRSAERGQITLDLPPGSHLLLYTDGLVEERVGSLGRRITALLRTLAAEVASGRDLEEMTDRLLATRPSSHVDDIAMLVLRSEPVPTGGHDEACPAGLGARAQANQQAGPTAVTSPRSPATP